MNSETSESQHRSKQKKRCLLAIIAIAATILAISWVVVLSRQIFYLGMTQQDIEKRCGSWCEILPLAQAVSIVPTDYERKQLPLYVGFMRSMGVTVHLNSYKQVIHIEFLVGPGKGQVGTSQNER